MIQFEFRAIGTAAELRPFLQLALDGTASAALITTGGTMAPTAPPQPSHDDDNGPADPNAPPIDAAGMPWDERIHSTKKARNADGTWRKRRGVDAATINGVEAELKARNAAPPQFTPPASNVPPPQFTPPQFTPPASNVPPQQYVPPQYTGPALNVTPVYTPPPQPQQYAPPPNAAPDLNGFMAHLSGQLQKRDAANMPLINGDYLARLAQELSQLMQRPINHIAEMGNDPVAIGHAINILSRDGKWQ